MKTMALLAAFAFATALVTTSAHAIPATPGASAHNEALVQVKHKKHKKSHKKMDQNEGRSDMGSGDKKGM
ncbi:hypothetical protein M2323_000717 [Rhodoblastus acidophilus]|uniref:hypothetical protein n=1 Tax=Rhodoblastus acidophilus TaxID=1074 RepID=UPI002224B4C6|nr:hypothetical protein [Rhodoblastus acidophilus]MCW2283136.1 hypothetical protein [Rhodoblastus acidophilus]MCW2331813.1 hypothetical protein [Rhodoblastus acidophilus]